MYDETNLTVEPGLAADFQRSAAGVPPSPVRHSVAPGESPELRTAGTEGHSPDPSTRMERHETLLANAVLAQTVRDLLGRTVSNPLRSDAVKCVRSGWLDPWLKSSSLCHGPASFRRCKHRLMAMTYVAEALLTPRGVVVQLPLLALNPRRRRRMGRLAATSRVAQALLDSQDPPVQLALLAA